MSAAAHSYLYDYFLIFASFVSVSIPSTLPLPPVFLFRLDISPAPTYFILSETEWGGRRGREWPELRAPPATPARRAERRADWQIYLSKPHRYKYYPLLLSLPSPPPLPTPSCSGSVQAATRYLANEVLKYGRPALSVSDQKHWSELFLLFHSDSSRNINLNSAKAGRLVQTDFTSLSPNWGTWLRSSGQTSDRTDLKVPPSSHLRRLRNANHSLNCGKK